MFLAHHHLVLRRNLRPPSLSRALRYKEQKHLPHNPGRNNLSASSQISQLFESTLLRADARVLQLFLTASACEHELKKIFKFVETTKSRH